MKNLLLKAGALLLLNSKKSWAGNDQNRFDSTFKHYADLYKFDWRWLKAIAMNESSLGEEKSVKRGLENPQDIEGSKSSDGKSWGLMQVTLKTAKGFDPDASEEKLNNPEYSINLASKLIAQNMKQFSKLDPRYVEWVIKSYNQGAFHTKSEMAGRPTNPAWQAHVQEYWARFKRNYDKIKND